jgi:hypothetical protein
MLKLLDYCKSMWKQAQVQHQANQANQAASVINAGVISIVVILVILIYSEIETALPSGKSLSGLLVFRSYTHEKPPGKFAHGVTPSTLVLQNASTNATKKAQALSNRFSPPRQHSSKNRRSGLPRVFVFANAFEIAPLIALVIIAAVTLSKSFRSIGFNHRRNFNVLSPASNQQVPMIDPG